MHKRFICLFIFTLSYISASTLLSAQPFHGTVRTATAGEIDVTCDETSGWQFDVTAEIIEEGIDIVKVDIQRSSASVPPKFRFRLEIPQKDIHNLWSSCNDTPHLYADWGGRYRSQLAQSMPVYAYFNDNCENRLTMAVDEAFRLV